MEFMDNDKFPEGLHVLVVDDNSTCLKFLEALLKKCRYEATTTPSAEFALDLLRKNKKNFDIILIDIEMDGGFSLLGIICREMSIPVISNDDNEQGTCDYQVKPPSLKDIQNICQHVVVHRKNKFNLSDSDIEKHENQRNLKMTCNNQTVISNEDEAAGSHPSDSDLKITRISWDPELHAKFVKAFYKLGDTVPSNIVSEMNVPGLTREKVSSHLQKYRMILENQRQKSDRITTCNGMSGHLLNRSLRNIDFKNRMNYLSRLKSYNSEMSQSSHGGVTLNSSIHSIINPKSQFLPSTQQHTSHYSSADDDLSAVIRPFQRQ
ncbi:hypothetical protein MKW98_019776 [Papaver atlanticum]|uniref:Response regulatory domain-containing protein n=1 Tax=Papaver atlanticum TaxID=357466 RepID=A0AAD4XWQ7_9MAGN|nr:hypothetical protein MKW98_019776 [Papaver atlanticum]